MDANEDARPTRRRRRWFAAAPAPGARAGWRAATAAALALALALALAGRAEAQATAPELPGARRLHAERRDEEASRRLAEAHRLRELLARDEGAAGQVLSELQRLDRQVALARAEADEARLHAASADETAAAADRAALEAAARHAAARRRTAAVLRALHVAGPLQAWRAFLVPGADGERRRASADAVQLALRGRRAARDLAAARDAAAAALHDARAAREAAGQREATADARAAALVRAREGRRARLLALQSDTARARGALAELELAGRELQGMLGGLVAPPRAGPRPAAPPVEVPETLAGVGALRGRLPWPADGPILTAFGSSVSTRWGTRTESHGVVIGAPEGEPFRSVAAGRVVFADWYKGFGLTVVVAHGGGDLSAFGHAQRLNVAPGDDVEAGQVLGAVGDTGSLEGPRLWFQLTAGGRPVDAARWLAPR
jgi:murein DD-endopeptidase MepM/ murein hydrolase activator NlpD